LAPRQSTVLSEKLFPRAAERWFDEIDRRGPRPRNTPGKDAQPVIDDRTRALTASLVETGIESTLPARPATLAGAIITWPLAEPQPTKAVSCNAINRLTVLVCTPVTVFSVLTQLVRTVI
jgi:hypothetical protein